MVVQALNIDQTLFWQNTAVGIRNSSEEPSYSWWIGGTLPDWPGRPLAVAVILETYDPDLAAKIGLTLLQVQITSDSAGLP